MPLGFRHKLLFAFLGLLITTHSARAEQNLSLPLSADKVEAYLHFNPTATVESFLADLPSSLHESFVLLHESRSMHQATLTQPRQILFGSDARFLIAVGSVDGDPRREQIEFAEFDPATGQYHFGSIDFAPFPRVERNQPLCEACHGRPTRPIWGQYPTWPGAYADNEGKIAVSEQVAFANFSATASSTERYRHLKFTATPDGSYFGLSERSYPFANTNLNHELGNTVAIGTVQRMRATSAYRTWRWALLASSPAMSCIDTNAWFDLLPMINAAYNQGTNSQYPATTKLSTKAYRLLGVDPGPDLSLEKFATNSTGGTAGYWQTGAFRIDEAVAFIILKELLGEDQALRDWFEPQKPTIDMIHSYIQLTGEPRALALRRSYGWFPFFDVFDPIIHSAAKHEAVCAHLTRRLKGVNLD